MPSPWNEASIARLTQLIKEKKTLRYITVEMGMTKNQVIGKAHRLGMRISERATPRSKKARRVLKSWSSGEQGLTDTLRVQQGQCRWPLWDGRGTGLSPLCGRETDEGSVYCEEHHYLAVDHSKPIKRKPRNPLY